MLRQAPQEAAVMRTHQKMTCPPCYAQILACTPVISLTCGRERNDSGPELERRTAI